MIGYKLTLHLRARQQYICFADTKRDELSLHFAAPFEQKDFVMFSFDVVQLFRENIISINLQLVHTGA